jgi:hypothetical protein
MGGNTMVVKMDEWQEVAESSPIEEKERTGKEKVIAGKHVVPKTQSNLEGKFIKFKARADVLLELVRDKIYSRANIYVQELLSNGYDSTRRRRAHESNGWVPKITIQVVDGKVIIEDNGMGMSSDVISNIYSIYGESDKRSETTSVGFFGIGAKSPFKVVDQFLVTSKSLEDNKVYEMAVTSAGIRVLSETDFDPEVDGDYGVRIEINDTNATLKEVTRICSLWDVEVEWIDKERKVVSGKEVEEVYKRPLMFKSETSQAGIYVFKNRHRDDVYYVNGIPYNDRNSVLGYRYQLVVVEKERQPDDDSILNILPNREDFEKDTKYTNLRGEVRKGLSKEMEKELEKTLGDTTFTELIKGDKKAKLLKDKIEFGKEVGVDMEEVELVKQLGKRKVLEYYPSERKQYDNEHEFDWISEMVNKKWKNVITSTPAQLSAIPTKRKSKAIQKHLDQINKKRKKDETDFRNTRILVLEADDPLWEIVEDIDEWPEYKSFECNSVSPYTHVIVYSTDEVDHDYRKRHKKMAKEERFPLDSPLTYPLILVDEGNNQSFAIETLLLRANGRKYQFNKHITGLYVHVVRNSSIGRKRVKKMREVGWELLKAEDYIIKEHEKKVEANRVRRREKFIDLPDGQVITFNQMMRKVKGKSLVYNIPKGVVIDSDTVFGICNNVGRNQGQLNDDDKEHLRIRKIEMIDGNETHFFRECIIEDFKIKQEKVIHQWHARRILEGLGEIGTVTVRLKRDQVKEEVDDSDNDDEDE